MTRFGLASLPLIAAALACKPSSDADLKPTKVDPREVGWAETDEDQGGQPLRAAGVELRLPKDWIVLAEDEPNFALAYRPEQRAPHVPVCTIELRRQGPGALPDGATPVADATDTFDYQRGALRGRVKTLPGPDPSAQVVVHCRAPRSTQQWSTISDLFAALKVDGPAAELPPQLPAAPSDAIVELCAGSPARMANVCARRADGAVYCGMSTGDALHKVALASPAAQISCLANTACARDAAGAVSCWTAGGEPEPLPEAGAARDIVEGFVVDERGKLLRRTQVGLAEFAPLDDPQLALTEVERVLPGTSAASGCVLSQGQLWCWDSVRALPLVLPDEGRPHPVTPAAGATGLARMGDRICVEADGRWTCRDADGRSFSVDDCGARACGCSLIGASRWSCEHEPYHPIDARPLGRVADVRAVADPCAARVDGTVVCRGPLAGGTGEEPGATKAIVADLPGIAHTLTLRDG